jgi:hypothetical protein
LTCGGQILPREPSDIGWLIIGQKPKNGVHYMTNKQTLQTVIALAKEHKSFTLVLLIAITMTIASFASQCNAHAEERGSCSTAAAVAKRALKNPPPAPTPPKPEKVTIVTLHVGLEPGQMVPPAPSDTAAANKRESGIVDHHMVHKYLVIAGE